MKAQELAPNGRAKVVVELVNADGNAFAILGRCMKAMRQAGWGTTEINDFRDKATLGDYNQLLTTVIDYCNDASEDEEDAEDEDE